MYNLAPAGEALFLEAVATIPEPATIALLGLVGLALLRRKR
ncbi:MAG: PEP-CTERM sorting domain-containing protein [Planctomycetota bacterium]